MMNMMLYSSILSGFVTLGHIHTGHPYCIVLKHNAPPHLAIAPWLVPFVFTLLQNGPDLNAIADTCMANLHHQEVSVYKKHSLIGHDKDS